MNRQTLTLGLLLILTAACMGGSRDLEVQPVPDELLPLAERWNWAERNAAEQKLERFYLVWSISHTMNEGGFIGCVDHQGSGKIRVSELLNGNNGGLIPSGPKQLARCGSDTCGELALFLEMERRSGRWSLKDVQPASFNSWISLRAVPVYWLKRVGQEESLRRLEWLFDGNPQPGLRKDLVTAIGLHGQSDLIVSLLKKALDKGQDSRVRKSAVFWLSQQAARKACSALEDVVADTDEKSELREQAVFALSQHELGVDALIKLAKSGHAARLRRKAIFWLGQSDDPRALQTILDILER